MRGVVTPATRAILSISTGLIQTTFCLKNKACEVQQLLEKPYTPKFVVITVLQFIYFPSLHSI